MDLNKWRNYFKNLDLNTFLASVISTMGAITTEDITQILYVLCAIAAQIFAMKLSASREKITRDGMNIENEIKKESLLLAKEERRSLIIKNDEQSKSKKDI